MSGIATAPLYMDVTVPESKQWTHEIPKEHNAFVYVIEGEGLVGADSTKVGASTLACKFSINII